MLSAAVSGLHLSPSPLSLPVCRVGQCTITTTISRIHRNPSLSSQNRPHACQNGSEWPFCPLKRKHRLFILNSERESNFLPDLCPSTLPLLVMLLLRSFRFMATSGFHLPLPSTWDLGPRRSCLLLISQGPPQTLLLGADLSNYPSLASPPRGPLSHSPAFFFVVSGIILAYPESIL